MSVGNNVQGKWSHCKQVLYDIPYIAVFDKQLSFVTATSLAQHRCTVMLVTSASMLCLILQHFTSLLMLSVLCQAWAELLLDMLSCIHSFGLIAIKPLATADTPQINPTGNKRGPDWLVPNRGRSTATCAADAAAKPLISVLFEGSEKLF